jgi:hypothetical protein
VAWRIPIPRPTLARFFDRLRGVMELIRGFSPAARGVAQGVRAAQSARPTFDARWSARSAWLGSES